MDLERAERLQARTAVGGDVYAQILAEDTARLDMDNDQERRRWQEVGPAILDRAWIGIYLQARADKRWNPDEVAEERTWTGYWKRHLQEHIDDEIADRIKRAKRKIAEWEAKLAALGVN